MFANASLWLQTAVTAAAVLSQDLAQNVGIPVWHCGGLFESAGTDVLNACINQGITLF